MVTLQLKPLKYDVTKCNSNIVLGKAKNIHAVFGLLITTSK